MNGELFTLSLLGLGTEYDGQLKQMRTLPVSSERGGRCLNCPLGRWLQLGVGGQPVLMMGEAGNSDDSGLGQLRRSIFMSSETRKVSPPATLLMAPQDGRFQGLLCEGHAASGDNCVNKSGKYRHSWLGHKHHPQRFTSKIECQSNTRLTLVTIGKWVLSGSLTFREITKLSF